MDEDDKNIEDDDEEEEDGFAYPSSFLVSVSKDKRGIG